MCSISIKREEMVQAFHESLSTTKLTQSSIPQSTAMYSHLASMKMTQDVIMRLLQLGVVSRRDRHNCTICSARGQCLALRSTKKTVFHSFQQFDRTFRQPRCLNFLIWKFLW